MSDLRSGDRGSGGGSERAAFLRQEQGSPMHYGLLAGAASEVWDEERSGECA